MLYKKCLRCVMDSDSGKAITFDSNGVCNYCKDAVDRIKNNCYDDGGVRLNEMVQKLKSYGEGKKYDCIMGVSGGIDSSYLLYLGNKLGLRILAVHVDDGFDTDISKNNIARLNEKCENVTLINVYPDSEQFYDLTKASILAGVPNICAAQDNVISAVMYKYAIEYDIKYFLSGLNCATEALLEADNTYFFIDKVNITSIHEIYGKKPADKIPLISLKERDLVRWLYKKETITPLDYIDYNVKRAFKELNDFCGFEYYGLKHHENLLTKFNQIYYLYNKFGSDKRKSHLSSLIVSGQTSREEAEEILKAPPCGKEINGEIELVISKLGFTREEFEKVMAEPPQFHEKYKTSSYVAIRNMPASLKKMKAKYENKSAFIDFTENVKREKTEKVFSEFKNAFECVNKALLLEFTSICHKNGIGIYDLAESVKTLSVYDLLNGALSNNGTAASNTPLVKLAQFGNDNSCGVYAKRILELLNFAGRSLHGSMVLLIGDGSAADEASLLHKLIKELNDYAIIPMLYDGTCDNLGDNNDFYYKIGELNENVLECVNLVVILDENKISDYEALCRRARLILDTRNALASVENRHNIILF